MYEWLENKGVTIGGITGCILWLLGHNKINIIKSTFMHVIFFVLRMHLSSGHRCWENPGSKSGIFPLWGLFSNLSTLWIHNALSLYISLLLSLVLSLCASDMQVYFRSLKLWDGVFLTPACLPEDHINLSFNLIRSLLRGFHWQNDSLNDLLKPVFSPRKVFFHFQIVVAAQSDYIEVENDGLVLLR